MDALLRNEDVLVDADLVRPQERSLRMARKAVQQVEDRVAPVRMIRIARRQIDVYLLGAATEGGARDADLLRRAPLLDEGWVARRPEAAIEPVVVDVAIE